MEASLVRLGQSNDAVCVRAHWVNAYTLTALTINSVVFSLQNSGSSLLGGLASNNYCRYRWKSLVIKVGSITGATVALGLQDDQAVSTPTSISAISALRTSTLDLNDSSEVDPQCEYRPVDKKRWYYTIAGTDLRDSVAFSQFVVSTIAGTLYVEYSASVVFSGRLGVNGNDVPRSLNFFDRELPVIPATMLDHLSDDTDDEPVHISHPRGLRVAPASPLVSSQRR